MSLVSCAYVGDALTNWLITATVEQKLALCAALNCGPTDEQIAATFLDCNSQAHIPGNSIPTCQQMNDAIEEAIGNLGFNFADDGTVRVTGDGSEANPYKLDVKISPQGGNRLEVRDGMLGVFDAAPPNLANQYVSYALGDDANDGTRSSPLKTLTEASRRISQESAGYGTYIINFRAAETHVVDQFLHPMQNADLIFQVYDDPIYGDRGDDCPAYYSYFAPNLSRPVLDFRPYPQPTGGGTVWPNARCASLTLAGVVSNTPTVLPTAPGGVPRFIYDASGLIWLAGADLNIYAGHGVRASSMYYQLTRASIASGASFVDILRGPNINADDIEGYTYPACGSKPSFTSRDGNIRSVVNHTNIGGASDPVTKTMFGFNTSWDIFV